MSALSMRLEADGPPPPAWNGLIASASWPRVREALTLSQRSQLHGVLIALPAQTRPRVVAELLVQVERMPFGPALPVALSRASGWLSADLHRAARGGSLCQPAQHAVVHPDAAVGGRGPERVAKQRAVAPVQGDPAWAAAVVEQGL
jgi:hypothetical protein